MIEVALLLVSKNTIILTKSEARLTSGFRGACWTFDLCFRRQCEDWSGMQGELPTFLLLRAVIFEELSADDPFFGRRIRREQ